MQGTNNLPFGLTPRRTMFSRRLDDRYQTQITTATSPMQFWMQRFTPVHSLREQRGKESLEPGLLLREAMQSPEAPNQIHGVNPHHRTIREEFRECS